MFREIPEATGLAAYYHSNLKEGRILLQSCGNCANVWHYPRPVCPSCGSKEFDWMAASGNGVISTFTVIHYPPKPEYTRDVPYTLAMVDLIEGARLTAIISSDGEQDVDIGDAVNAEFPVSETGVPGMPVFRRVQA